MAEFTSGQDMSLGEQTLAVLVVPVYVSGTACVRHVTFCKSMNSTRFGYIE